MISVKISITTYLDKKQTYLALKYHLITPEDLFQELASHPVDDKHLLAYYHYTLLISEGTFPDAKPFFLDMNPDYLLIYVLSNLPFLTCDETELGLRLTPAIIKFYRRENPYNKFKRFLEIITGHRDEIGDYQEMEWVISARQYTKIKAGEMLPFPICVNHDAINVMLQTINIMTYDQLSSLLNHCEELQRNQPELWFHLAKEYLDFFQQVYKSSRARYFPDLHPKLIKLLPELFPQDHHTFSCLAWYLYHLPLSQAAYYLGYPLDLTTPNHENLRPAFIKLSQVGIDEYSKVFTSENKNFTTARIKVDTVWTLFHQDEPFFINSDDTLHEDVFSYPASDLLILPDTHGRFFILTAPEFPNILRTGKNHWNNNLIPEAIKDVIIIHQEFRRDNNLPSSKPLGDLLRDLDFIVNSYSSNPEYHLNLGSSNIRQRVYRNLSTI